MGVILVLLIMAISIYLIVILIGSLMAYYDGKDDADRYYGRYDNNYWMPMAFAYEYAYSKWDGRKQLTAKDKNKKRFNRG